MQTLDCCSENQAIFAPPAREGKEILVDDDRKVKDDSCDI